MNDWSFGFKLFGALLLGTALSWGICVPLVVAIHRWPLLAIPGWLLVAFVVVKVCRR